MEYNETYSLLNVGKIIAGAGSIERLKELVGGYEGKTALIITDKGVAGAGLIEKPAAVLKDAGLAVEIIDSVPPEPETAEVIATYDRAKNINCAVIIGIGGGSVMDVAKLVSVMFTNNSEISLSQMLDGAKIENRGLPTIMIPTTAGTGSEVTPNSIVLVAAKELKIGIVSEKLMPDCVILDPLTTINLPPAVTASTGMDALAHAIECYISKKANPFSDTFALKAISLISRSIRTAYNNGQDIGARHDMLLGAMFGGICIATSSTTAVHALAYPLGGKYRIPHGLSNAVLLPHVMKFNAEAAADKFKDIALAMGLNVAGLSAGEAAEKMIENLYSLIEDLHIEVNFQERGITHADIDSMADAALKVTRLLNNNPRPMAKEDICEIYKKLL